MIFSFLGIVYFCRQFAFYLLCWLNPSARVLMKINVCAPRATLPSGFSHPYSVARGTISLVVELIDSLVLKALISLLLFILGISWIIQCVYVMFWNCCPSVVDWYPQVSWIHVWLQCKHFFRCIQFLSKEDVCILKGFLFVVV